MFSFPIHQIFPFPGVVWHFSGSLTGAKEGLDVIRNLGKRLVYVSNNSFNSRECYEERFLNLNIPFHYAKDLLHPAAATVDYLKKYQVTGTVFVIASEAFVKVLEEAGITCYSMVS